jgi:calpain
MKGKIPLIRLRNPWGNEAEWKGAFCDGSPEWRCIPEHAKREIGLTFNNDGEFWMTFRDFLQYFDRVEICHLCPDSLGLDDRGLNTQKRKNWKITTFEGEWTRGISAGGCRNYLESFWMNPQYIISLAEPDEGDQEGLCTVIIALMQKYRRSRKNIDVGCLQIGFGIYKMSERDLQQKPQKINFFKYNATIARSPPFVNMREVSCRFRFPPGHYMIVPSSFMPNEEAEFLIRIFSESKNKMVENDKELGRGEVSNEVKKEIENPAKSTPEKSALWDVFQGFSGDDKEMDWTELQKIMNHCMRDGMSFSLIFNFVLIFNSNFSVFKEGFSKELCRSMVAMLDRDQSGQLGFEEFVALLEDLVMWKVKLSLLMY